MPKKWLFLNAALLALLVSLPSLGIRAKETQMVDGPCSYKAYQGQARIVSMDIDQESKLYEIKFSFTSKENVKELDGKIGGKNFMFRNFNPPFLTKQYVDDHNIAIGNVYDAVMSVIETGACTPVMLDVPAFQPK